MAAWRRSSRAPDGHAGCARATSAPRRLHAPAPSLFDRNEGRRRDPLGSVTATELRPQKRQGEASLEGSGFSPALSDPPNGRLLAQSSPPCAGEALELAFALLV